ncbi:MAG TPA: tyrosine-type recombinase/integrase [Gemmataceae bacterium]|nr:tyrosine-type recombinase/integrase [Gemmataceae bacterium]
MSGKSTRKPRSRKVADRPEKPYPDFPLTPHASGAWQKKIRGKVHYFGRWARRVNGKLERIERDGWEDALELYKFQADDLHAGRTPRTRSDGLTVIELCNRFLTAKHRQWEAGEITSRMYEPIGPKVEEPKAKGEYPATTDRLIAQFGGTRLVNDLAADDFEALRDSLAKKYGPVRLGNEIQKVRTVFKYGYESGLIDNPLRYGPQFKKPSASVMRRHRVNNGERMLEARELRSLINAAGLPLKAMILLGVNAGFGNTDCARLPMSALNLDAGWVTYPRPKTGIARRSPLWPETVAAIQGALAARPEPKDKSDAGLVFITKYGGAWGSDGVATAVTHEMTKLLRRVGINGRKGLGFYTLRHVFRTVADGVRDPVAVDLIMGHTDPSIGARYRERIDDGRLQAVTERVRAWVFGRERERDEKAAKEPT